MRIMCKCFYLNSSLYLQFRKQSMKVSQSTQVAVAAVTSSASDTIIARRAEGEVVFIV